MANVILGSGSTDDASPTAGMYVTIWNGTANRDVLLGNFLKQIYDTSKDHVYIVAVSELTANRTITLPLLTGNDVFVFADFVQTLTNKRVTKRVTSETSNATPTPNADTTDQHVITAQAAAAAFAAPTGTPTQGQPLVIRIKDNGTARALTWNAIYRAMGTALPSTTVLSKTLYLGFFYNSTDTKWDLVASAQEA